MREIGQNDDEAKSTDLVMENFQSLKALFPELVTEGPGGFSVNVDVLKELVGDQTVTDCEEKYGLNWFGKRNARKLALTPSTGTLRPSPEESENWETTENLMIEGDNLEVLKLLQNRYSGKVKLIYIDPPYNTGNDFVYPDNFQDNIKNYLELTGQIEDGAKISSNTETSGRFHTNWLNMMYPRLKLARNLLREDGVIFISIDNTELSNLRKLCDEIFGEENFVGNITWKARVKPVNIGEAKYRPQDETEYVVMYQKSDIEGKFQPLHTGGVRSYPHELNGRKYRLTTILKSNRGSNFRNTMSFEIDGYTPPDGQRWQGGEEEIKRLNREGYLEFRDGTPFKRYFEDEEDAEHDPFYCFMESDWTSTSEAGKSELNELLGDNHGFDTVKPTRLIKTLVQTITVPSNNELVLDFFGGSGTTGNAIMSQNAADTGNRRYILIQFPELLDPENKDQKTAANFCDQLGKPRTIAELTKERLRRAAKKIKEDNPDYQGDLGFRVLKLDSSNIRAWDPNPPDIKNALLNHLEHLKPDRSERDILFELLLKLGLSLTVPIEEKSIAGKVVYSVGSGALFVCLAEKIESSDVEPLSMGIVQWKRELLPEVEVQVVFRDSAFSSDVAKTNLTSILEQNGFSRNNVRSL